MIRAALAGLVLALPSCASADGAPATVQPMGGAQWRAVDAATGQIRDVEGLEQLARDFPDSGTVRLRLLQPYLEAGEAGKLLETLEWLKARGYVFSEVAQEQISKLIGEEYAEEARDLLIPAPAIVERSEVVATIPARAGLVESVLRLEGMAGVLATSVSKGRIFSTGREGQWLDWGPDDVANLSGIASAQSEGRYWVSAGAIDGRDADESDFSGLIELAAPGIERHRIAAPKGVNLSDLTRGPDGTLYASDPMGGGVYKASPQASTLETLVAPGVLRSPQGLAVSDDGSHLYVSDYRYGIAIVDLTTGGVSRLSSSLPLILDGIDGMWRREDELIVIQNGTSPMRIAALRLSEDGTGVVGHRTLEQAHSGWTEPLSGNLYGDALLYVGNGQWDRFVEGMPAQDKPPLETQIRRLPLD